MTRKLRTTTSFFVSTLYTAVYALIKGAIYSQILWRVCRKLYIFVILYGFWWQTDRKQEIQKHSFKVLFIWTELPIIV